MFEVIPYGLSGVPEKTDFNYKDHAEFLDEGWDKQATQPAEKKTSFGTKVWNFLLDAVKPKPTEETKKDTQGNANNPPPQEPQKREQKLPDEQALFDSLTPEQRKLYVKNNPDSPVVKNYLMWRNIKIGGAVAGGVLVIGGGVYLWRRSHSQKTD